jgi:hypothetical protein
MHEFGIVGDNREQPEAFRIELAGMLAHQHPREALNGPERALEIVEHGMSEGFHFSVRRFQLDRSVA